MRTTLTRECGGRVARVQYDNAARGNSFDEAALLELASLLEEAAGDADCVLVRLDMAGQHFCGGWDTSSFSSLAQSTIGEVADALQASDAILDRVRRLPVPIIAAVRGHVVGFGAGLLDAVHLPIAADDTQLSLPEVSYGFAPAGVGHALAQALPRTQAYALLTGLAAANATQLLAWGLVAQVVPDAELDAWVDDLVAKLASTPGQVLRAVVDVVESSRETGTAERAFLASAGTIVESAAIGDPR